MNIEKPTGIFLVTSDPLHLGHIALARGVMDSGLVDGLELVVTNHHPEKTMQASFGQRFALACLAVHEFFGNDPDIHVSDAELHLATPSFSHATFRYFMREMGNIMPVFGSDNLPYVRQWEGMKEILEATGAIIVPRVAVVVDQQHLMPNMTVLDVSIPALSSHIIREMRSRAVLSGSVGNAAAQYIAENHLYAFS